MTELKRIITTDYTGIIYKPLFRKTFIKFDFKLRIGNMITYECTCLLKYKIVGTTLIINESDIYIKQQKKFYKLSDYNLALNWIVNHRYMIFENCKTFE